MNIVLAVICMTAAHAVLDKTFGLSFWPRLYFIMPVLLLFLALEK